MESYDNCTVKVEELADVWQAIAYTEIKYELMEHVVAYKLIVEDGDLNIKKNVFAIIAINRVTADMQSYITKGFPVDNADAAIYSILHKESMVIEGILERDNVESLTSMVEDNTSVTENTQDIARVVFIAVMLLLVLLLLFSYIVIKW